MKSAVPEPVSRLSEAFARLPGVGPRTASRLTYYLLRAPDEVGLTLADALRALKAETQLCSQCFHITVEDPCELCADSGRDRSLIAVVEEPLDVLALERTGSFKGLYHVLHGAISPLNNIGPDELRIRELVQRASLPEVSEIIIATNPGMEGDATAMFIERSLEGRGLRLTRLARGLPVGGDLEYVDPVTLTRALLGRSEQG